MSVTSEVTLLSNDQQIYQRRSCTTYFDAAGSTKRSFANFDKSVSISRAQLSAALRRPVENKKVKKFLLSCIGAIFFILYLTLGLGWKCIKKLCLCLKNILLSANQGVLIRSAAAFGVMVVLLAAGFFMYTNATEAGYKIVSNGVVLGTVREKSDYYLALSGANAEVASQYGARYLSSANITFEKAVFLKDDFSSPEELTEAAYGANHNLTMSYMITVDDADIVSAATLEDAQQILDGFKNQFLTEESLGIEYANEISIEKKYAPKYMVTDVENGVDYLNSLLPQDTETETASVSSDAPQSILMTASASGTENMFSRGLSKLRVVSVEQAQITETVPFETETVENPNRYTNTKSVVLQEGSEGEKTIDLEVTKLNGDVVSETPVSETITKEPVNKIVEVGTKPLPKGVGTGSFRIPVKGYVITSKYGNRSSGFHTGIDLAVPYGAKVCASDEGVVTFAGWKGGYGYLVIIDHKNGYETYYAHNSKIQVKVGQIVEKGDAIAKAGSTGNSTGSHCHFEIRKNGKYVNPYSYLF